MRALVADQFSVFDLRSVIEILIQNPASSIDECAAAVRQQRAPLLSIIHARVAGGPVDAIAVDLADHRGELTETERDALRARVAAAADEHHRAIVLTPPSERTAIRDLLWPELPDLRVLSTDDLLPDRAEIVAEVGLATV
jgi:flagellar biosynthesis component FlhA